MKTLVKWIAKCRRIIGRRRADASMMDWIDRSLAPLVGLVDDTQLADEVGDGCKWIYLGADGEWHLLEPKPIRSWSIAPRSKQSP